MTKPLTVLAVLAAATAASGCGGFRQALGAEKVAPDEFRVVTRAPLQLPPDYSLRPPRPGEARPQERPASEEARAALFGQDLGRDASAGERTLVARAGAEAVDPTIRDQVDFEGANIVHRDQGFVDRLLRFGASEQEQAEDAEAEARRIADQEAIRRVTGGAPVVIERREGGGFKLPGT